MFYYSPVLLWKGTAADITQAAVSGCIGVWFLAASTEGFFAGRLAMPLRFVMFAAALCLIHPGTVTDLIGLAAGIPIYLWQRLRQRRAIA
jgi:TRAP-type uncharacterized transport system fused permease subunit